MATKKKINYKKLFLYVVCVLSIAILALGFYNAKTSITSAASVQEIHLVITPPAPKVICGDGICTANEMCPADCLSKEEIEAQIMEIKYSYMILALLIIIVCLISYAYFKEDSPPKKYGKQKYQ